MRRLSMLLALSLIFCAQAAHGMTREDAERAEGLKMKALEHFNAKEYNKAIPLLREVLSINPNDRIATRYLLIVKRQIIEPYCKKAADAYLLGDYPGAISLWERIAEIDPEDARVRALIEETFYTSDSDVQESMFDHASTFIKEGRYAEASVELKKIIESYPDNIRARDLLESVNRTLTDSAIKELYDMAEAYRASQDYPQAVKEWSRILELDPNQELASRMIASIQKRQLDELYVAAEDLYMAGDYMAAREHYKTLLQENPTDQNIKDVIERLGNTINVVPTLKAEGKAWDIVRKGIANYLAREGNPRVAVAALWYAAQLEPESTSILAIQEFMERENATMIRSMETPVKDMNLVDQYLFAALNHIYEGRYDLSIQLSSLVAELEPGNVLALKRMGSAYYAMNKRAKAREVWEQALKLYPDDAELKRFLSQTK